MGVKETCVFGGGLFLSWMLLVIFFPIMFLLAMLYLIYFFLLKKNRETIKTGDFSRSMLPEEKLDRLIEDIEAWKGIEESKFVNDWKRIYVLNFGVGLVRGLGFAMGTSVFFYMVVMAVKNLIDMNLPFLSKWLAVFIQMVEESK